MRSAICLVFPAILKMLYGQSVGDNCTLPGKGRAECREIFDCPSALDGLRIGIIPVSCGFVGNSPVVCCAITKSEQMCRQYGNEIKGTLSYAAVGGVAASLGEFPHMAALGFGDQNNIQWQCGGSLISPKFVLTAAHCLLHSSYGEVKYVRMGDVRLDGTDEKIVQNFNVIRRIPHPEYKPPSTYNDIALLELDHPANYSLFVKPACLHTNLTITPETRFLFLEATGWGLTKYGGEPSVLLQKVSLDIFGDDECRNYYKPQKRRLPKGILEDIQVCAGGKKEEKDTCPGDSGGPLHFLKAPEYLRAVVGVTSFGKSCGTPGVPGVYARVAYYAPWIESIVWPDE